MNVKISILRRLFCLCLILSLAGGMLSCNMYSQRKVADEAYMTARTEMITVERPEGSDDYTVYAVMVDIDAGDHVETVVCYADGTTHLLLSTGQTYTHLEKTVPALTEAAQALLSGLGERLDHTLWVSKTDLSLPRTGKDMLYLAGDKGIYTLTVDPASLSEASEAVNAIYELYRAVYTLADTAVDTQA